MSEYISREAVLSLIKQACNPYGKPTIDFEVGKRMMQVVKQMPSADITECAMEIKEYCRDRDNLDEPCEDCPFHFYDGFAGFCVLNFGLYPNEWFKPDKWDLPEGEKE